MVVYMAINKTTDKIYIGSTRIGLKKRIRSHIALSKHRNNKFSIALRTYGADDFVFKTIDYADNSAELIAKEKYWIGFYNTKHDGYNSSSGGEGRELQYPRRVCKECEISFGGRCEKHNVELMKKILSGLVI